MFVGRIAGHRAQDGVARALGPEAGHHDGHLARWRVILILIISTAMILTCSKWTGASVNCVAECSTLLPALNIPCEDKEVTTSIVSTS